MLAPSAALSKRYTSYLLWTFLLFSWTKCLGQPSVTVSPHSGPPTSTIVVGGKGFGAYKAVDIFFDTTDEALVVANGSGTFSGIAVSTPASAKPGTHWISAVQRAGQVGAQVSFLVSTNWSHFHFAPDHIGFNPFENVLSPSNVPGMTLNWKFPTVGQVELSPVQSNGVVYVGAGFQVSALNSTTGKLLWQYTAGDFVGTPAVANGIVYTTSADGNVYALSAANGALRWTFQTSPGIPAAKLCVANETVYVGSWNTNLYALNAKTGALNWKFNAGTDIESIPAVANKMVFFAANNFGAQNGIFYALDTDTGNVLWQFTLPFFFDASPTVVNGVVYIGSGDKNLYALNSQTGALLWKYATDSAERTSPAVGNGVVYVTSGGGFIYALNAYNGKLLWRYNTGSGDDGFPPSSASLANNVVYAGFQDGKVYAWHARTGSLLWQYVAGNAISSTPVITNGTVYIGSWDNNLYAFGVFAPTRAKRPQLSALKPNPSLKLSE
jgi:outer membrane protein assembly factor BamB